MCDGFLVSFISLAYELFSNKNKVQRYFIERIPILYHISSMHLDIECEWEEMIIAKRQWLFPGSWGLLNMNEFAWTLIHWKLHGKACHTMNSEILLQNSEFILKNRIKLTTLITWPNCTSPHSFFIQSQTLGLTENIRKEPLIPNYVLLLK